MHNVIVTKKARLDIKDIYNYLADYSVSAAEKLNAKFFALFNTLAFNPRIGRSRHEEWPNIRSIAIENYSVFYRFDESKLEIVRILHGKRDIRPETVKL